MVDTFCEIYASILALCLTPFHAFHKLEGTPFQEGGELRQADNGLVSICVGRGPRHSGSPFLGEESRPDPLPVTVDLLRGLFEEHTYSFIMPRNAVRVAFWHGCRCRVDVLSSWRVD